MNNDIKTQGVIDLKSVVTRNIIFSACFIGLILLASFPGLFDFSNKIEPRIFSLSFAYFWQISMNILIFALLIIWYFVDSKYGDLDIDIEPLTKAELLEREVTR